jgi:hypothetical protein
MYIAKENTQGAIRFITLATDIQIQITLIIDNMVIMLMEKALLKSIIT